MLIYKLEIKIQSIPTHKKKKMKKEKKKVAKRAGPETLSIIKGRGFLLRAGQG